MRISLNWLRDYVDVRLDAAELAHRLTMAGLEVSAIETLGADIDGVVVAEIVEKGPHPGADRLSLCRVTDGSETHDIVCGASNMGVGDKVALARVGTRLPGGFKIKKAKIRGQASFGMMCSVRELGLGEDHAGILILPPESELGQPLVAALGLPDTVFEVDLTPNRADCLSVVGVAREVAALVGAELRLPQPVIEASGPDVREQTSVRIEDPDLCHRYAARVIRDVRLGPSPLWMQQRLQAAGVRSLGNVIDVTNYVLLELGHPLHAFDMNRLGEERIVVRRAAAGDRFTTLDGQERALHDDTLMICDAAGPVAVAGIMGGLNSEVQQDTVDVLLESAYFLPENIRRSSKQLGLSTEASYRFERGTDIDGLLLALDRATQLIVELAGGTVAQGVWDAYPTPHPVHQVPCRPSQVSAVLGVTVGREEMIRYLTALGLGVVAEDDTQVTFSVPTHRVDLEREIDLIEEVARIRGYDTIPTTAPRVPMAGADLPTGLAISERARDALVAVGLQEAINLSFVDPAEDDRLGYAADDPLRAKITLQNPLSSETTVLRTSLLSGLLRAGSLNCRRQTGDLRLFEVGNTFHPQAEASLPLETLRVAALVGGRRAPLGWLGGESEVDFFDVKGMVETFLATLGVAGVEFAAVVDLPWLHPGRAARLLRDGEELGWCGQIHPDRVEAYEIPAHSYAFELDLGRLGELAQTPGSFAGLDRYPAVERDVALVVDRATTAQQVLAAARGFDTEWLRSVTLFDVYEGDRLAAGKVSLALRTVYRSEERTLTEPEIQEVESALLQHLEQAVGARLRGA